LFVRKVKVSPLQATKALRAGRGITIQLRPRHWRWGWVVRTTPRPRYPLERPGTHCTGGWVDTMTGLDGCGKFGPPPEFHPLNVQLLASLYTDWAIPDASVLHYFSFINILKLTENCRCFCPIWQCFSHWT
jgi:hypothetical protein